jgi:hypothetical protein
MTSEADTGISGLPLRTTQPWDESLMTSLKRPFRLTSMLDAQGTNEIGREKWYSTGL